MSSSLFFIKIKPRDINAGFFIVFLSLSTDKTIAKRPSSLKSFLSLISCDPVEPIPSPSI